jgi:hypothetical protein
VEVGESSLVDPDSSTTSAVAEQDYYIEITGNLVVHHPVRKKL